MLSVREPDAGHRVPGAEHCEREQRETARRNPIVELNRNLAQAEQRAEDYREAKPAALITAHSRADNLRLELSAEHAQSRLADLESGQVPAQLEY